MTTDIIGDIAIVHSDAPIITDGQTALDFIVNAGAYKIAVNKGLVSEDFFKLSTGLAGEVVQKFVNYGCRLAIIGDFSHYTSKSLKDYIYECNNGKHLYFAENTDDAIEKLKQN
jgi:hypothetical protein